MYFTDLISFLTKIDANKSLEFEGLSCNSGHSGVKRKQNRLHGTERIFTSTHCMEQTEN